MPFWLWDDKTRGVTKEDSNGVINTFASIFNSNNSPFTRTGRVHAREALDTRGGGSQRLSQAKESGQESLHQGKEAGKEQLRAVKGKTQNEWESTKGEARESARSVRKKAEKFFGNREPPPAYADMGKPVKDLLTKGFVTGASVAFTSAPVDNVLMTTTGTQSDDLITGLVTTVVQMPPYNFQLATGSTGIVIGTVTADNLAEQGIKATVDTAYPGVRDSFKAKLAFSQSLLNAHVAVEKFARNPTLESSVVFGTRELSGGFRGRYSLQADSLGLEAGLQLSLPGALTISGKIDLMDQKNSAFYILQEPTPKMQVGLEILDPWNAAGSKDDRHRLSAVVKGQLDERTAMKARVSKDARIGFLIEHKVGASTASLYVDLDSMDLNSAPKTGISISLMNM